MRLIDADELFDRVGEIESQHKHQYGEWEKIGVAEVAYDITGIKTWGQKRFCTNCGFKKTYIEDFGFYSICPSCGAIMRPRVLDQAVDGEGMDGNVKEGEEK